MTLADLQAESKAGNVTTEDSPTSGGGGGSGGGSSTPAAASSASQSASDFEQYVPVVVGLQSTQRVLTGAPTFIPQTFEDQIQFVYDGTNYYLYFYANNQWNKTAAAGDIGLKSKSGTDTATLNTHSGSTTHTITHALGATPKIITVSGQLNPNGVPGSNFNGGIGIGTIILDATGNPIGGMAVALSTGSPAGSFGYQSISALANSFGASSTTSGGTANMSITVNNVTPTTFDIVYTVSDNGGAGAPTQNFSATWNVMA
jgi:hypothetical protein